MKGVRGRVLIFKTQSTNARIYITNPSLWVCPSWAWVICLPPASHRRRCSSWEWSRGPQPSPHLRRFSSPGSVLEQEPAVFLLPDDLISRALLTECPETRTFNFKLSLKFMQSIKSWSTFFCQHFYQQQPVLGQLSTWKPPDTGPAESFSGLFHFLMRPFVPILLFAKLLRRSVPESGFTTPVSYFRINRLVGLDFACKWEKDLQGDGG